MTEVQKFKNQMNKSFRQGLILVAISVWFIPGIFFQFFSFDPTNSEGFINKLFQFSYGIAPDITSINEIIAIVTNGGTAADLLTSGNIIAFLIIMIFAVGCGSLSGASKQQDKLYKLNQEAREERMKAEM